MRALGWFNIAYGLLGLFSAAMLAYVMPENPLPPAMMATSVAASAYAITTGIALVIWGPRALAYAKGRIRAAWNARFARAGR